MPFGFEIGFGRVPEAVTPAFGTTLRTKLAMRCDGRLDENGIAETVSLDATDDDEALLIGEMAALAAEATGTPFHDVRFIGAAVIPKYPGEGRRRWHVDWWNWNSSDTGRLTPPQVGVILYLDDATWQTGSLEVLEKRFIPGYGPRLLGTKFEAPRDIHVALDCPKRTAVVLDSRTLHAVGPNITKQVRMACTLWYLIGWSSLCESTQAGAMPCADRSLDGLLGTLQPDYKGSLPPTPHVKIPPYAGIMRGS